MRRASLLLFVLSGCGGDGATSADEKAVARWIKDQAGSTEIQFVEWGPNDLNGSVSRFWRDHSGEPRNSLAAKMRFLNQPVLFWEADSAVRVRFASVEQGRRQEADKIFFLKGGQVITFTENPHGKGWIEKMAAE